jgi:hypothetical protein
MTTSILFRNGEYIFEIDPNNGFDVSVLDLDYFKGPMISKNS